MVVETAQGPAPLPPGIQISAGETQRTSRPRASLLYSEAPGEDTGPQDALAQALPHAPQPPLPTQEGPSTLASTHATLRKGL